jgi:hypothetical protein
MASQLTIQNAINFVSAMIKQQRLLVNNLEPAITIANIILGRMLGAPCIWRFNRSNTSVEILESAGSDYNVTIPTLGRIETQWLVDASGNIHELNGAQSLAKPTSGNIGRPSLVAPQYDDNAGDITFRFNAIPDQLYVAYFDFQQKPPTLSAPGQSFAPVPDEFGYIFNILFLGWAGWLVNDARSPIWLNEGISALLGAQDGLSEQAKAIFIADWMATMATITRATGAAQAGVAGRTK